MIFLSVSVLTMLFLAVPGERPPGSCSDRTGFRAGTVVVAGGKRHDANSFEVLDIGEKASLWVAEPPSGAPRRIPLQLGGKALEGSGIARAQDGSLCTLALGGRSLRCFSARTGEFRSDRPLSLRSQGVWNIAGTLVWASFEAAPGQPLLYRETKAGFEPSSLLSAHGGPDRLTALTANLVQCGIGLLESTPCWFADSRDVFILGRTSVSRRVTVPKSPGPAPRYAIRDVLLANPHLIWLLVNDPPSQKETLVGKANRLVRLDADSGAIRTFPLTRPGKSLLDGNPESVLVLFQNGGAARCGEVEP